MKRILLTYLIIVFGLQILVAQNKSMVSADTYFEKRDYVHAIKHYKKAIKKSDNLTDQKNIAYQIAISYYNMNDYQGALDWFEDAIDNRTNNNELYFKYSEALAIEQRYDEAISILTSIEKSADSSLAKQKIAGIKLLTSNLHIDSLGLIRLEEQLNSEYSDYGIAFWDNKFVVSSTRKDDFNGSIDGRTGQGFSNLFSSFSDDTNSSWSKPKKISGKFNSNENEGNFCYDSINQTAYWTRCTDKSDLCLIYLSHYNSFKDSWTKPEKAPFQLPGYDYGHPFISNNGQTLIFTSNMKNGFGGKDIWKVNRKQDGSWGIPVNLGAEVNTEVNEVFPSIYGDTLLFFASDKFGGLGKYDIYFSLKDGLNFNKVSNLGYPINSAADDYGVLLNKNGRNGWFCSDRNFETSDDIYYFKGFPIKIVISGKVLHKLDNSPMVEAKIVFKDSEDNLDTLLTNSDGEFLLYLDAFDEYRISASKDKYYTDYKTVDTRSKEILFSPPPQKNVIFYLSRTEYPCAIKGLITNKETKKPMGDVKVEIYTEDGFSNYTKSDENGIYIFEGLKPSTIYTIRTSKHGYFSESRVSTLPKIDKSTVFSRINGYDLDFELLKIQVKTEILLSNIYYDFNKSSLRETSKVELNKLASMLIETSKVIVQISAHTDEIGSPSYNLKLSAARAQSVVDYLIIKGITRNRLIAKGYGESNLLIKNARTDAEHQANRRTTFKVVEIMGSSSKEISNTEFDIDENFEGTLETKVDLYYRIQIATTSKRKDTNSSFNNIKNNISPVEIIENIVGSVYKYEVGDRKTISQARQLQKSLKALGYKDCFINSYYKGNKIPVSEAVNLEKGLN